MLGRVAGVFAVALGIGMLLPDIQRDTPDAPAVKIESSDNADIRTADSSSVQTRRTVKQRQRVEAPERERRRRLEPELRQPKSYEIIYLGSEACPACRRWEADQYADWRRDPIRRKVPVRMAEVERFSVNRGVRGEDFGRYHRIYERAFKDRRFAFPSFVLMDGRQIVDAGTGARTWNRFAHMAREEVQYAEWREEVLRRQRSAGR
ncbi:MAG: hypothetical protein AAF292_10325 [Pseudomonadota bacterium]